MKPTIFTVHMVTGIFIWYEIYQRYIVKVKQTTKNRRDFIDIDKHQIHIPFRFILISYWSLLTAMGILTHI